MGSYFSLTRRVRREVPNHRARMTPSRCRHRAMFAALLPRELTIPRGQHMCMTTALNASPVPFGGNVADIARDWSITIRSAPPGPPRRVDGYTIGAIPNIDRPGPHGGEVHPDGDEFLYVVRGTMELILDDGDERAVGVETKVLLRSGDAYVVPRGVWHRLEPVEPSYLIHVTPGPSGGYRPRDSVQH
jgi:mannose-6-phosphate isomerase-like protein (cupin superfamily)